MPRPFVEEYLVSEPLFDESFAAVAGKDSRWARRRLIELAEPLMKRGCCSPPDSVPGYLLPRSFVSMA